MWLRFYLLLCLSGCCSGVLAQDALLTPDAVQSRLEAVGKSAVLAEEAKVAIRDLYQTGAGRVEDRRRGSRPSRAVFADGPHRAGRPWSSTARIVVAAGIPRSHADHRGAWSASERLTECEAELAQRQAEFDQLSDEPNRRALRRRDIPKQRATVRKQLDDVQRQLAVPPQPGELPELTLARTSYLQAKARALQETLDAGAVELDAYQATIDLLPLETDLAAARVALLQREAKALRTALERRRKSEVDEHLLQAAEDVAALSDSELLAAQANANLQIVERRKELREQIDETSRELAAVAEMADEFDQRRTRIKEKVDTVGLTGAIGLMLRKQKALLPDVSKYRQDMRERQPKLKAWQLAALEFGERRADLADLDAALARVADQIEVDTGKPLSDDDLQKMRKLLAAERRYMGYLVTDTNTHVEHLLELDGAQRQLIADTEQLEQYIDERVLWVRSAETLSAADLPVATEAVRYLGRLDPWKELGAALVADVRSRLILYWLVMATVVLAHAAGRLLRSRRTRPRAGEDRPNRLARLSREVLEIVLCAAPWPLLLWFIGSRLSGLPSESGFVHAFGTGLASVAANLLLLSLLLQICRPRGFARRRLGWSSEGIRRLRTMLAVLMFVVLPPAFVYVTLSAQDNVRWQDSLGRICFVAILVIGALIAERLLRPRTGVLYRTLRPPQDETLDAAAMAVVRGWASAHTSVWRSSPLSASAMQPIAWANRCGRRSCCCSA